MICDTDYIRPSENTKVHREDNIPRLKAVQSDALSRFEKELTGKKAQR